jgi:hypothetical protein
MPAPAGTPISPVGLKLRLLADRIDLGLASGDPLRVVLDAHLEAVTGVADDLGIGDAHVVAAMRDTAAASTAMAVRLHALEHRAEQAVPILERSVAAHEREAAAAAEAAEAAKVRRSLITSAVGAVGPETTRLVVAIALTLASTLLAQRCGVDPAQLLGATAPLEGGP